MALPVKIPEQYRAGLLKLRSLSEESMNELVSAIEKVPLAIDIDFLVSELSNQVNTIEQRDLREITSALLSLYSLQAQLDWSISYIADSISRTVEQTANDSEEVSINSQEVYKERLETLLNLETLDTTGKASDLMFEHEHALRETRILTDIRPIFGVNAKEKPKSAIVTHTLKVSYYDDAQYKDFFVALDDSDIDRLAVQITRAKEKSESLRAILELAKVKAVDTWDRGTSD